MATAHDFGPKLCEFSIEGNFSVIKQYPNISVLTIKYCQYTLYQKDILYCNFKMNNDMFKRLNTKLLTRNYRYIDMSKEWFILQFKPNSHLKAVMNLNRLGFETFLPLHKHTSHKLSRSVNTYKPLFSGYMFVTFDRTNTHWYKINSTYGVLRLITFNSVLISVPKNFIENLMQRCDLNGKLLPAKKLKKGDQVIILNGPFTNFAATVETLEADKRIWVLMDLMGRETKIKTNLNNIEQLY